MVQVVGEPGVHGDLVPLLPELASRDTGTRAVEEHAVHLGGDVIEGALLCARLSDRDRPVRVRVAAGVAGREVEPEHLPLLEQVAREEKRPHVRYDVAERADVDVRGGAASVQELGAERGHLLERAQADLVLGNTRAGRLDGGGQALVRHLGRPADVGGVPFGRRGDELCPDRRPFGREPRVRDGRLEHLAVDERGRAGEEPDPRTLDARGREGVAHRRAKLVGEPGPAGVRVGADVLDEGHLACLVEVPGLVEEQDRVLLERQEEERARPGKDVDVAGEVADRVGIHLGRAVDEERVQPSPGHRVACALETSFLLPDGRLGRPAARLLYLGVEVQDDTHSGLRLSVTSFISVISSIA